MDVDFFDFKQYFTVPHQFQSELIEFQSIPSWILSLCCLSIIFEENSATGVNFIRIFHQWSFLLQNMKILKLSYNYSENENKVLKYFIQILASYVL